MTGAYVYTPGIWPPVAAALVLTALGLYSWRRRRAPGALPLAAGSLFAALWLMGIAFEAAAALPEVRTAWFKFIVVWQLLAATAGTCFVLEYVYPGRWLTRRNLTLLALPPLLNVLLVLIADNHQLLWRRLQIGPDGSVLPQYSTTGLILVVYRVGLILVNVCRPALAVPSFPAASLARGAHPGRTDREPWIVRARLRPHSFVDSGGSRRRRGSPGVGHVCRGTVRLSQPGIKDDLA